MTFNERLYQIGESIFHPFALQYTIMGKGNIALEELHIQVNRLASLFPVLSLQLKGNSWYSTGNKPQIIVHEGAFPKNWNDPIFHKRLHAEMGQCAEFHLFQHENSTLIFRILHSAMDAKGVQMILKSLFALMRGEEVVGEAEFKSDMFARASLSKQGSTIRENYKLRWPGFSLPRESPTHYYTEIIRLEHQVDASLAKWASCYVSALGKEARLMIPVDLRRHAALSDSASNLTLPVYLHIEPEQHWQDIQASLLKALVNHEELARERLEGIAQMAPGALLRWVILHTLKKSVKTGQFPMSGILSDNGFMDLADLSTDKFIATDVISLPVYVPLAPCCFTALHHSNGSTCTISVPAGTDLSPLIQQFHAMVQDDKASIANEIAAKDYSEEDFQKIRTIWARELGCAVDLISQDTPFHQLGGDSLKLLHMLSNVAFQYIQGAPNAFFDEALSIGGQLNISILMELIDRFR